ncbi:MAG: protein-disulfide reductase DsbD domain-containing protein [Verrucomicrobiales bacterium]
MTRAFTGGLLAAVGSFATSVAAEPHVAKGLTLELVADRSELVPGKPISLGVALKPDEGFHTYWRQPGLVGLTPTVTWSLPEGFQVGELLWPEPQRGKMAAYGVWCLKRETCLVAPITVPATLDPKTTPSLTFKASVVWMACSRTCHPGTADLTLTLPVRAAETENASVPPGARLIAQTRQEQPAEATGWSFAARYHGPQHGFSLTITPPSGRSVPADAYFYGHQRLVDSNVEPLRHNLPDGTVRLDLALVEEPDAIPEIFIGELWSESLWVNEQGAKLLMVRAPLSVSTEGK